MELSKLQERFINYKSSGYQLLKGKEGSGKSTSLVYKALNLENNYCLYNEDKILIVNSDHSKKTLKLNGEYPVLMPANNAYPAIPLEGREVTILGVVIGIIKNKNNFQ